jgi:hypothetical protein
VCRFVWLEDRHDPISLKVPKANRHDRDHRTGYVKAVHNLLKPVDFVSDVLELFRVLFRFIAEVFELAGDFPEFDQNKADVRGWVKVARSYRRQSVRTRDAIVRRLPPAMPPLSH